MIKSLAAGMLALGAAVGAVFLTSRTTVAPAVQLTVFDAPLAPAADIPSADQLTGLLNGLADPGVPFADKAGLVEGGVGGAEASMADHKLQKAAARGSCRWRSGWSTSSRPVPLRPPPT